MFAGYHKDPQVYAGDRRRPCRSQQCKADGAAQEETTEIS